MSRPRSSCLGPLAATAAVMGLVVAAPASAAVSFVEGHQQVGNGIHMNGDHNTYVVTGSVHPGGPAVEFKNAFSAASEAMKLHTNSGVAKIEACKPCDPPNEYVHVPFTAIEMVVEPGWGLTDMDWAITPWDGGATGLVTFTAYESSGQSTTQTFTILGSSGQDKWHFHATGSTLVKRLTFSSSIDIHHLEQMSASYAPVPESGTLLLMALGLATIVPVVRRRN